MRITHVFHFWSKRILLFKVVIFLTSLYSLSLLTRTLNSSGVSRQENQLSSYSISQRNFDGRKASLQLNWIQNEDETKKKQVFKRFQGIGAITKEDNRVDMKLNEKLNGSTFSKPKKITNFSLIMTDKPSDFPVVSRYYPRQYKTDNLQPSSENTSPTRRRYIFAFRYYEQLAMATNNLISLASLGKHYNRQIVMPFVNNSRMNGVRYQISKRRKINKFVDLSKYFNVHHVNMTLLERGYSTMAYFTDFFNDCRNHIDVLVHFLFKDSFAEKDAVNWFGISKATWKSTRLKASKNNGWTTCDFLKNTGMESLLEDAKIHRYICVDPEKITSPKTLEDLVFKDASCVGIFHWKGNGTNRTHFPVPEAVLERLRPSDLRHNQNLIDIAKKFVETNLKRPFLAVHIRAERHLMWKGIDQLLRCIKKLTKKTLQRKKLFNINQIFIATDLPVYGSDTFHNGKSRERTLANRYLVDALNKPVVFDPTQYGMHDRGEIAIIEMHILSLGESLYTLGGGNFQDWIVDLFLARNVEDRSLVHKFCLLR